VSTSPPSSDGFGHDPGVRICVLGVGLIGGSVALAARRRLGAHVTGWDPDRAALDRARLDGVIDEAVDDPAAGADAELWVVAAPVDALEATVRLALGAAGPDAVVADTGSVKGALVAAIDDERFVGSHPLAGAETGGVEHAREDLFDGATWYLTPGPRTSGVAYERLHRFLANLGARPAAIDAAAHDRLMAAVSHLPHILANVLVEQATEALDDGVLPPVGPSFRDATRVAGANPQLWAQIYAANTPALREQVDAAIARLTDVRGRLDDLLAWQEDARARREALVAAADAGAGTATAELRVHVPNRPGVVAELALALGRAGVNIADLSLSPSPDGARGLVGLWVAAADRERARELIASQGLEVQ
jgi:prephenate dehydrogenase